MGEPANEFELRGDLPKTRLAEDEFGLSGLVKAIANAASSRVSDGYVIGIEGSWGSGKTTLVHFVAEQLTGTDPNNEIIFFDPWLVGEKTAALKVFLGLLAGKIEQIDDRYHSWYRLDYWLSKWFRKTLSEQIKHYGQYIAALATPVGSLSAIDPTGTISLTAAGLKSAGWLTTFFGAKQLSLAELKRSITRHLTALQRRHPKLRIVVIVDDTDRLEPAEAAEVLRLVRRVADFPILTYLLCFDRSVLAKQIETALQIADGNLYIDKIFQSIVSIPPQEPFALRRYLRKTLAASFPNVFGANNSDSHDAQYLEHVVFDIWLGIFIETPRDAARLIDAVLFGWPNVDGHCNFLDFVWLQLIKLKFPQLYQWTQRYLTNIAAYRDGGRPGDIEPTKHAAELREIFSAQGLPQKSYLSGLNTLLPGVESIDLDGEKSKVYDFQHNELAQFEQNARLGSPTHWRLYFAYELPTYAISDALISEFRSAIAQDHAKAEEILNELLERPHSRRGHFVDVLFDRLLDTPHDSYSDSEREGFIIVFSEIMDRIALETKDIQDFGRNEIWRKSLRLLSAAAGKTFVSVTSNAKAINWLAEVLRDQGAAHGLPDGNRVDESRQWLNKRMLDTSVQIYIRRILKTPYDQIFAGPSPLDILFLAIQLGDKKDIQSYVRNAARKEDGFLTVLEGMRSWSASSDKGIRHPLNSDYVEQFMDPAWVKKRLAAMARKNATQAYRTRANLLLKEWTDRSTK